MSPRVYTILILYTQLWVMIRKSYRDFHTYIPVVGDNNLVLFFGLDGGLNNPEAWGLDRHQGLADGSLPGLGCITALGRSVLAWNNLGQGLAKILYNIPMAVVS